MGKQLLQGITMAKAGNRNKIMSNL